MAAPVHSGSDSANFAALFAMCGAVQVVASNENKRGECEHSLDAAEAVLANFKKRDELVSECVLL